MASLPARVVATWLNKMIVSVVPLDRCREVFRSSGRLRDPAFLEGLERISADIDRLVLDLSLLSDLKEMAKALDEAPQGVADGFIARTFLKMEELENMEGLFTFAFPKGPDIRDAMREILILDPQLRTSRPRR